MYIKTLTSDIYRCKVICKVRECILYIHKSAREQYDVHRQIRVNPLIHRTRNGLYSFLDIKGGDVFNGIW